jgi:hypothetical protein
MRGSDLSPFQTWGDVVAVIAKDLQAYVQSKSAEVERIPAEEASNRHPWAALTRGEISQVYETVFEIVMGILQGLRIYGSLPAMMDRKSDWPKPSEPGRHTQPMG